MEDEDINQAAYEAARDKCDEDVTYTAAQLPQKWVDRGYDRTTKRYSCNGVYLESDDIEEIERQIVRSMAGKVVDFAGESIMYAGAPRTPRATIQVPEDLVEKFGTFSPGVPLQLRGNYFHMQLAQSAQDDYTPEPLAPYEDSPALERDQKRYEANFGVARFINDKIQGARILAIMAREVARATSSYGYRISPGDNFERHSWMPGDQLLIIDPEIGIGNADLDGDGDPDGFRVVIDKINYDKDLSMILEVSEYDTLIHEDTFIQPQLNLRVIEYGVQPTIPVPSGLVVTPVLKEQEDGTLRTFLKISWTNHTPALVGETELRIRELATGEVIELDTVGDANELNPDWQTFSTDDDPPWLVPLITTTLIAGDTAVYQLRHVSPAPLSNTSSWTVARTIALTADSTPPVDPTNVKVTPLASAYKISWDYPSEGDYSYTLVEAREDVTGAVFEEIVKFDGSSHTVPAEPEESYEIRVTHYDTTGHSSGSVTIQVTTLTAAEGIISVDRNPRTGTVTILYGSFDWSTLVEDTMSTATEYRHTGLDADSYHQYRVSAHNAVGVGPFSKSDGERTDDVTT